MLEKLKRSWQCFKTDPPGQRFQQQFKRRRQAGRTAIQKALFIGSGILLMVVGVFFLFVPGPGLVVILLGAVLVAQQSLAAARALDWAEVRIRKLLRRSFAAWRSFSTAMKILLAVLALIAVGAVGVGAFKFLIA